MPKTYTTVQGDAWDSISLKFYGTEKKLSALIEANPAYLETVIFPGGLRIMIPDLPDADIPDNLPPWKRGAV